MFIHVCQQALIYKLVEYYKIRNLGLYMVFMFSFNALYTSRELQSQEKICFRGLRSGRRHKSGFTAIEASWRLEFGFKERTSTFDFALAQ